MLLPELSLSLSLPFSRARFPWMLNDEEGELKWKKTFNPFYLSESLCTQTHSTQISPAKTSPTV